MSIQISTDTLHRIRDYAVAEPSFTVPFAVWELGVGRAAVDAAVEKLLHGGIIEQIEPKSGPYAAVYAYKPIPGEGTTVRRSFGDDVLIRPLVKRGEVVPHTRARGPSGKPGENKKRSARGVRVKRARQGT